MPNQDPSTATTTPVLDGPQWRALLEASWQARGPHPRDAVLPRCDAEPGGPW